MRAGVVCYYGNMVDERTGKETRFSTGVEVPREGVKESTLRRAEAKARQRVIEKIEEMREEEEEKRRKEKEPERISFGKAFTEWLATISARERTIRDYEADRDAALMPSFGGRAVCDITPKHVRTFLGKYKDHSRRTRAKYLSLLRRFMTDAVRVGYAKTNPTDGFKAGGQKKERKKLALTPDEARRLLQSLREPVVIKIAPDPKRKHKKAGWEQTHTPPEKLHLATAIAIYVGLRPPGAVEALRWTHVDFKKHRVVLPAELVKTEIDLVVPLYPALERLLKRALARRKDAKPSDPVVGRLQNYRRNLQAASRRCGLATELKSDPLKARDVTPYDMRRTFSTWLECEVRAPRSIVKRLRGDIMNDTNDVADTYMIPTWQMCVEAIEAMPDVLSEQKVVDRKEGVG